MHLPLPLVICQARIFHTKRIYFQCWNCLLDFPHKDWPQNQPLPALCLTRQFYFHCIFFELYLARIWDNVHLSMKWILPQHRPAKTKIESTLVQYEYTSKVLRSCKTKHSCLIFPSFTKFRMKTRWLILWFISMSFVCKPWHLIISNIKVARMCIQWFRFEPISQLSPSPMSWT